MMEKRKNNIFVAFALISTGILIALIALIMVGFDFERLNDEHTEKKNYTTSENIDSIIVSSDVSKVNIKKTAGDTCRVEYVESNKTRINVTLENGTLEIKEKDKRKWYDFVRFSFLTSYNYKINIYLPEDQYESLKVRTDTGSIRVDSISVKEKIKLEADTGSVDVENLTCEELICDVDTGHIDIDDINSDAVTLSTDTGSISAKDTIVKGHFKASTDTGSVKINDIEADTIDIKTDTGSIKGTVYGPMIFKAKTDTGSINVPDSDEGGLCNLKTDTGSIKVKYSNKSR